MFDRRAPGPMMILALQARVPPPPPTEIRPVQVRQSHLLILILVALVSVLFDVEAKLELGNLRSGMESVVLMVLRFPREEAVDGCDMCVEPSGRLHGTDTAEPLCVVEFELL